MSQKQVQIYEDSVLKLSIKQGEESDRIPARAKGIGSIDYEMSSIMPGAFTMGELAYTRDTNRVFVGNFTTDNTFLYATPYAEDKNQKIQQTVGGTLTGNKYLGYIDTKPPFNNFNSDAKPISLTEDSSYLIDDDGMLSTVVSKGALVDGSDFRSYEFTPDEDSKNCVLTEDGKWSRQSFYNEKYDAYDGDYMYDIYRNALIVFDHNIKPTTDEEGPTDSEVQSTRRRSKLVPLETDNKVDGDTTAQNSVYEHTLDMYGDGYVCIYNVVPDGDTLTFQERKFSNTTGIPEKGNYTQNAIKVQKVYAGAMIGALDKDCFELTTNNATNVEQITLTPSQEFDNISLPDGSTHLILPNGIGLESNVLINFQPFSRATSDKGYTLKFEYDSLSADSVPILNGSFEETTGAPTYTLHLGNGLSSSTGEPFIRFDSDHTSNKLVLESKSTSGSSSVTANPFNIPNASSANLYTANLMLGVNGAITGENCYDEIYANSVKSITDNYDNENTKFNYLNASMPIAQVTAAISDKKFKFKFDPVVYCSNPSTDTTYNTVGISATSVTVDNGKEGGSLTLEESDLKSNYFFTENGKIYRDSDSNFSGPEEYDEKDSGKVAYVNHPINGTTNKFIKASDAGTTYDIIDIENEKVIKISKEKDLKFKIKISDPTDDELEPTTYENLDLIYNSYTGKAYAPSEIDALAADIIADADSEKVTILKDTDDIEVISISFKEYYIKNENYNDLVRFEFKSNDKIHLLNIPTHRYATKFVYNEEENVLSTAELSNITSVTCYYSDTTDSASTFREYTYNTPEGLKTLSNRYIDEDFIFTKPGETGVNDRYRIYKIDINNDIETISFNFVNANYTIESSSDTNWVRTSITPDTGNPEEIKAATIDYNAMGSSENQIKVMEQITTIDLKETVYYSSEDLDITKFLDAWPFYYEDVNETTTIGGKTLTGDALEQWLTNRRIEVMQMFPIIPTHTTSVLLKCETKANSTLTVKMIGNGKAFNPATISGCTLTGVFKSEDLRSGSTWDTDKTLLDIGASSTAYIEVPVSIDNADNKHFTFSATTGGTAGEALISIAAYKV